VRTAKTIVAGILVAACMIAYHGHMQGAAGAMPELFTQFIESFSSSLLPRTLGGALYPSLPGAQTATIDWGDVHQTIDGFGGSCADFVHALTASQADFFFTVSGIGLSLLRTQIIPDAATCNAYFENGGCTNSNGQSLNGELETARQAVARGVTVWSTPWSPPGIYKSNHSFTNGGYLLSARYSDWASKIARYVTMMAGHGVPIYAVSVQNEPNISTTYGSCTYTGRQIHDFVPFLHAALQSAGVGATRIVIAEDSRWNVDLASNTMADLNVAPAVGILAAHGYGGSTIQQFSSRGARLWQTEDSSPTPTYDGSITDGLTWAKIIHSYLTVANVNAWHWWFLSNMAGHGYGLDNSALTDINGNYPKRAYVTGQWSKFVRPGWVRTGARYSGSLQISAFKDPQSARFAIVVVNSGPATSLALSLNGFSTTAVEPWITSATLSLAAQPSVSVNGGAFTYPLPGSSVTTFSGK
jgi:glucuronoarabinoxylan endo-1,4-beta-xylanase